MKDGHFESLTFFRATNSFSAVARSATSSSYLGTEDTRLRIEEGEKRDRLKAQMIIFQDLDLWSRHDSSLCSWILLANAGQAGALHLSEARVSGLWFSGVGWAWLWSLPLLSHHLGPNSVPRTSAGTQRVSLKNE